MNNNPIIDKLSWHFEIEATHRKAGFQSLDHAFLSDRFHEYVKWMKSNGILLPEFKLQKTTLDDIEIRKNDFSAFGWNFCQKYQEKFIDRMYKSKTIEEDLKYLNKWLKNSKENTEPLL